MQEEKYHDPYTVTSATTLGIRRTVNGCTVLDFNLAKKQQGPREHFAGAEPSPNTTMDADASRLTAESARPWQGPGLQPNRTDINNHLHALFPPEFVHRFPHAEIEVVYGPPGNLSASRWFSAFDLKTIIDFAEVRAANDDNIYVGAALRLGPIPEKGRAKTENFLAANCAWVEFDAAGDAERIDVILKQRQLAPALVITTGSTPHLRQHVYFRIKDGVTDAATMKAVNQALRDLLGTDDVTDAIRIMRLAGCINTPTEKKRERGYIQEIVTVKIVREPREYTADELIVLGGKPSTAEAKGGHHDFNDYARKSRRTDNDLLALLEESRVAEHWHNAIRDAMASMIGRGWGDDAIRFVCAPYCNGGAEDHDLDPLIEGARAKWNKPDADNRQQSASQASQQPLPFIDMSTWDEDVPPREWTVRDIIARRIPFLLSGEGATGKTLLALQLAVAHVLGRDWLGTLPEQGPVIFLGAEDETDELHRRLHDILNFQGAAFADIVGQLHLLSFAGEDAVLGHTDRRTGLVMPTPLYSRLLRAATEIRPVMICLDTSADVFAGDEISRFEVRQFVSLLRKLAITANGAVVITSHPSLTGINSGTGLSGSTGWHNSVRGRAYLTTAKTDKDEEPDPTLRLLEFKKNNYGPVAKSMSLRWERGVFRLVGGPSSMDQLGREQTAERLFLALLDRFNDQGRNVSDKTTAKNYAPTAFAKEADAKKYHIRKADFEAAMRRLFERSMISVQRYGPPSRGATRLVTR